MYTLLYTIAVAFKLPLIHTGIEQLPLAEVEEATKEVCSDWYSLAVELEISYRFRKVREVTDHL